MDISTLKKNVTGYLQKYKYAILIFLVGLVLMALPKLDILENEPSETAPVTAQKIETIDGELAAILSRIEGVGKVEVMLTIASGEETVYQTDNQSSDSESGCSVRTETVIVTDSQKNQSGLICQVNPVRYQGAIIVCQGADSPAVQLAITEAVRKVTGLGTDRISVLKMK